MRLRSKQSYCAIAALLVFGVLVVCWLQPRGKREPTYQGRTLSFWVQQNVPSATNLPFAVTLSPEAASALRQIGTNAVPTLIRWMRYPDKSPVMKVSNWLQEKQRAPRIARSLVPQSFQPLNAVFAFQALGTNGACAIPSLMEMLHRPQEARSAAMALCAIGTPGVIALGEHLPTIHDGILRADIINDLYYVQSPDLQVQLEPILVQRLTNDSHAATRLSAAQVLGNFTNAAGAAFALATAIRDQDGGVRSTALRGLGNFGRTAVAVAPVLEEALTNKNPKVRADATNALLLIRGR